MRKFVLTIKRRKKMEIIATNAGGGNFKIIPAGNHIARCYSMVHIGTLEEEYLGEKKWQNKIRLSFETPQETAIFSEEKGEQPFSVSKEFTLSLHEKATLRKFLESWRGKGFTEEEATKFDVAKLLGVPCMVNVIHKQSAKGNTYAEISSISAMPKGITCPAQINPTLGFTINAPDLTVFNSLPDFLKDKIKRSKEFASWQMPTNTETPSEPEKVEDDGLPF